MAAGARSVGVRSRNLGLEHYQIDASRDTEHLSVMNLVRQSRWFQFVFCLST